MPSSTEPGRRPRAQRRSRTGPTIADVARVAGVSLMTVSRVMNGVNVVSVATRAKVEGAIATLGYVPNAAARSLAGGRQCRLALLYDNPSAAFLSELLVGALAGASAGDHELVIERWSGDDVAALIGRLVASRIDAALLPPPVCDDAALLAALRAAGLPAAQIATGRPDAPVAVAIDDAAAARVVTGHLIDAGHRRIGLIEGHPNQTASILRRQGYEAALAAAGIPFDPALVQPGDFTYRSGLGAAAALLAIEPRPTAIFASNDDMAAAAISSAHRLGLDVPADLSVCGFDDTAIATAVWPELTTVRQPIADMAQLATRLLGDAITIGDDTPRERHRQFPFELMRRGSVGPPPP